MLNNDAKRQQKDGQWHETVELKEIDKHTGTNQSSHSVHFPLPADSQNPKDPVVCQLVTKGKSLC